jgi:hypothetical protein
VPKKRVVKDKVKVVFKDKVKVPKNENLKGSDPLNGNVNKNVKESDSKNESVKGLKAKDFLEKEQRLESQRSKRVRPEKLTFSIES